MVKWEYTVMAMTLNIGALNLLNHMGQHGWELVSIDNNTVGIFKRPLVRKKTPQLENI